MEEVVVEGAHGSGEPGGAVDDGNGHDAGVGVDVGLGAGGGGQGGGDHGGLVADPWVGLDDVPSGTRLELGLACLRQ